MQTHYHKRGRGPVQVVLVHPEIPPNTGNIARLCAAMGVSLHLVRPLGFSLEDRYLRRAGLDYWPLVDLIVHDDWARFLVAAGDDEIILHSARAGKLIARAPYERGETVWLVFGSESRGLPREILDAWPERCFRIPTFERRVRSLNLANAVAIALYECLRRRGALPAD